MKRHIHIHLYRTADAGTFKESDHPRKDNGQFGSGGGGKSAAVGKAPAAAYPREAKLKGREAEVQEHIATKLERDFPGAVKAYANLPDSKGGKVLNTDVGRELSEHYLKDRSLAAAVHEPVSHFMKQLYKAKLAELPKGSNVMFTAGGAGAGKSSALQGIPAVKDQEDKSGLVYDTNMSNADSAERLINQALDAGHNVHIVHVLRDPVDAFNNGALSRAMRQEAEFGTGRVVPYTEHAKNHRGSSQVVPQLAEKYKNDPRVKIDVIDNTRGAGKAALSNLDFVKGFDYNGLEERLRNELESARKSGRISEAVYRGTLGAAS